MSIKIFRTDNLNELINLLEIVAGSDIISSYKIISDLSRGQMETTIEITLYLRGPRIRNMKLPLEEYSMTQPSSGMVYVGDGTIEMMEITSDSEDKMLCFYHFFKRRYPESFQGIEEGQAFWIVMDVQIPREDWDFVKAGAFIEGKDPFWKELLEMVKDDMIPVKKSLDKLRVEVISRILEEC